MNNDELERRSEHVPRARKAGGDGPEIDTASRSHGFDRSVQPSINNIEFRGLQGEWPASEYSYLHSMGWHPETGSFNIKYTSGRTVLVTGRNLRQVYERLRRHRIDFLQEQGKDSPDDLAAGPDEAVIYRIEVMDPQ